MISKLVWLLMFQGQSHKRSGATQGPSTSRWRGQWSQLISPIAPFLSAVSERLIQEVNTFEPGIVNYARYAVDAQGKQIRPTLLGLSANALDGITEELVRAAVIIEMIHLATLVHDDVMDQATIRRKRPTLALRCGTTTSVLLGDCMFAHALTLAAQYPTPDICRAVASAAKTVCTGEILQSEGAYGLELSRQDYLRILQMKTAELFALSCQLGAWLGKAPERCVIALREYGMALGTAYQLYDDCLDLYGDEAEAGKSLGIDLATGKLTLPILLLLERGGNQMRARLQEKIQSWRPGDREEVRQWLNDWDVGPECLKMISGFCDLAVQRLCEVNKTPAVAILSRIAEYLRDEAAVLIGCV